MIKQGTVYLLANGMGTALAQNRTRARGGLCARPGTGVRGGGGGGGGCGQNVMLVVEAQIKTNPTQTSRISVG